MRTTNRTTHKLYRAELASRCIFPQLLCPQVNVLGGNPLADTDTDAMRNEQGI